MLMDLRDRISGWIAYVIVGIIIIPFALWGIGEYFADGKDDPAAVVNGVDIPYRAYEQAYDVQRQQVMQMMGANAQQMIEAMGLKQQVLDGLVMSEVLNQYVREAGYRVSDRDLAQAISEVSVFQENGAFNQKRYESVLRFQGMSPAQFETRLRQDIAVEQFQNGLAGSAFALDVELDRFVRLRDQQRRLEVAVLDAAARQSALSLDEAALRAYFEKNQAAYQQPERVRLEYLEVSPALVMGEAVPDEATLKTLYEEYLSAHAAETKREARHILLSLPQGAPAEQDAEVRKKIEALAERIRGGESFADVARSESQDPGSAAEGGSLGMVGRGAMVEPFEKALFALEPGKLSDPVRTEFGYHLILVDRVVDEAPRTQEQMRDELIAQWREKEGESRYYELADRLAALAYEHPDSLTPAAEALNLKVNSSDWITRNGGEGIGQQVPVRTAAFVPEVLNERRNSDVLTLGPNHVAVVRVTEHEPAQARAFEDVRADVERAALAEALTTRMREEGDALAQAVRSGKSLQQAAEAAQARYTDTGWVGRRGGQVDPAILRAGFALSRPVADKPSVQVVQLGNGDVAVVRLMEVKDGDPTTLDASARDALRGQLARDFGLREVETMSRALRERADVKTRKDL